jgi:hypothetical protein
VLHQLWCKTNKKHLVDEIQNYISLWDYSFQGDDEYEDGRLLRSLAGTDRHYRGTYPNYQDDHRHDNRVSKHLWNVGKCPDDGGSDHLWKICEFLQGYTEQHPRRQTPSHISSTEHHSRIVSAPISFSFDSHLDPEILWLRLLDVIVGNFRDSKWN